MLDDLAYFHQIDKADTLGIAEREAEQLVYDFRVSLKPQPISNVVYAGMGGSALAAGLSLSWPGYKLPFEIVRNYELPVYVSEQTLCVIASNSGNTEETLSILQQAEQKMAQIIIITGGGKLKAIADQKAYPCYVVPPTKQPRYAVFYNLKALIDIGSSYNVFNDIDREAIAQAVTFLRDKVKNWQPQNAIKNNLAKRLALDCLGKSVVIYAGPKMSPAAYKWKISFNENAKQIAWAGTYPEFNHNEFIGWSNQPVDKPYMIIELRSDFELDKIKQRFELSDRLLSGKRPAPEVINLEGKNLLEQLLYAVLLGDFTSLYCAIAAGTNPEPVDLIEKFKTMMLG